MFCSYALFRRESKQKTLHHASLLSSALYFCLWWAKLWNTSWNLKKNINLIPQSEHSKFSVKKTSRFACKKQTWKIAKCWVISSFFFPAAAEDTSPLIACVLLCVSLIWKQLLVNCQGEDAETAPLQSTAVKILILFGQIPYDLHYIAAPLAQWVSRYTVVCWVKSASINL